MHNLRLVGIHEDGEHLLLADEDGTRHQLPLDDALRAAVRRERPRAVGERAEDDQEPMRPRDVQALIRTGVTLEEVAERAGWELEKVRRYEPPIRAERDYVAAQARDVDLRDRQGAISLGDRVARRLADRGVDAERVGWDSWKEDDASWKVLCLFPAGGRERRATWRFSVVDRTLVAVDDEARWLSEDEHGTSPGAPAPKIARPSRNATVYDVEAEGGVGAQVRPRPTSQPVVPAAEAADSAEESAVDLVSVMRERAASRRRRPKRRPTPTDTPIPTDEMPSDARPVERLDLSEVDAPPSGSRGEPEEPEFDEPDTSPAESAVDPDLDDGPRHDPVTGTGDLFEDLEAVSNGRTTSKRRRRGRRKATAAEAAPEPEVEETDQPGPEPEVDESDAPDVVRAHHDETDDDETDVDSNGDGDSDRDEYDAAENDAAEVREPVEVPGRQQSTRKGRPSVPSWDDIMFGSRRDD